MATFPASDTLADAELPRPPGPARPETVWRRDGDDDDRTMQATSRTGHQRTANMVDSAESFLLRRCSLVRRSTAPSERLKFQTLAAVIRHRASSAAVSLLKSDNGENMKKSAITWRPVGLADCTYHVRAHAEGKGEKCAIVGIVLRGRIQAGCGAFVAATFSLRRKSRTYDFLAESNRAGCTQHACLSSVAQLSIETT